MSELRKADWSIVAGGVLLLALAAEVYVGGYFWPYGKFEDRGDVRYRIVPEWKAVIYQPAARLESIIIGREVEFVGWLDN